MKTSDGWNRRYNRYSSPVPKPRTDIGMVRVNVGEYGAGSKAKQATCKAILEQFEMIFLTSIDQEWAMEQMERFRLSHGITLTDCLIASVAHRLQSTLQSASSQI